MRERAHVHLAFGDRRRDELREIAQLVGAGRLRIFAIRGGDMQAAVAVPELLQGFAAVVRVRPVSAQNAGNGAVQGVFIMSRHRGPDDSRPRIVPVRGNRQESSGHSVVRVLALTVKSILRLRAKDRRAGEPVAEFVGT